MKEKSKKELKMINLPSSFARQYILHFLVQQIPYPKCRRREGLNLSCGVRYSGCGQVEVIAALRRQRGHSLHRSPRALYRIILSAQKYSAAQFMLMDTLYISCLRLSAGRLAH